MRPEPRRTAERLGLDQRTIRWLEAHGHLRRLALTEPEIRARLYRAACRHCERGAVGAEGCSYGQPSCESRGRQAAQDADI